MKKYLCPACGREYAVENFTCEHCGRILASFVNASYALLNVPKFRIFTCSFYITEKRCIIKTVSDSYDDFGLIGAVASVIAEAKQSGAWRHFDSPWENLAGVQYPNSRIGNIINGISPNHGIIITYSDGTRVALGLTVKKAQEAYSLIR